MEFAKRRVLPDPPHEPDSVPVTGGNFPQPMPVEVAQSPFGD